MAAYGSVVASTIKLKQQQWEPLRVAQFLLHRAFDLELPRLDPRRRPGRASGMRSGTIMTATSRALSIHTAYSSRLRRGLATMTPAHTWRPASRTWQGFGLGKGEGRRVGAADVDV